MNTQPRSIEQIWGRLKKSAQPTTLASQEDIAFVDADISPLHPGRIKYQATYWFGKCDQATIVPAGTYVRVLRREGNTWIVQPLSC